MRARLQSGFTLVEVMIVVAIVAILTSIAVPAYTDYIRRGRITEAVGVLSAQRIRMEQFFQDNRTYVGACVGANTPAPEMRDTPIWDFDCPTAQLTAAGFQLVANGKPNTNMNGFVYSVRQGDVRSTTIDSAIVSGWTGSTTCWVLSKSGTC